MGSTGTVVAAERSIPGDPLYPVKLVGEHARLVLSFTDQRVEELQAVTDKGCHPVRNSPSGRDRTPLPAGASPDRTSGAEGGRGSGVRH